MVSWGLDWMKEKLSTDAPPGDDMTKLNLRTPFLERVGEAESSELQFYRCKVSAKNR